MASNLTEYEQRRLENIKRNEEMMASLKLRHMSTHLPSASKRQKIEKGYKSNLEKKPKSETPIVIRRSLRSSGIPPDAVSAKGLQSELADSPQKPTNPSVGADHSIRESGPLRLQQAYNGTQASYLQFINTISGMSENVPLSSSKKGTAACYDLGALDLKQENVARLVPSRIFTVGFFPFVGRTVIFAGDKGGNVGFWDVDCEERAGNGLYLYSPHSAPVSGILVQHFLTKIFTSSYDGFIRLMNITEETFNMVYSGNDAIFSISQRPLDVNSLYFGEGQGMLKAWDERAGKIASEYELHDRRINSIDFSTANTNLMATSSTDATACLWDVRRIGRNQPQCIKTVHHKRAVHSAYFSPSGSCLATTSFDSMHDDGDDWKASNLWTLF
ncbi:hypothetical protein ACLOJK_027435 [Asimina triloba]